MSTSSVPTLISNDVVCEVNDLLQKMSTTGGTDNVSVCGNCGKEGSSDIMNTCNKCNIVKYCNATCKKKHRSKHKRECEKYVRLAAELVTEKHDEKLFKQPPPKEDCPICFLRMPSLATGSRYMSCCGKKLCSGCTLAPLYDNQGNKVNNKKCAFCRTPDPTSRGESIKRLKIRMEAGDPIAIYNHGNYYRDGRNGFPQNHTKALELYHHAAELGNIQAYLSIGVLYAQGGRGVEINEMKANYYHELAAMKGSVFARYNLGLSEQHAGNMDRAAKHFIIATSLGDSESLKKIQELYKDGRATKEDYTKGLQAYQAYLGEIKSVQRDKAAAANEGYRYY